MIPKAIVLGGLWWTAWCAGGEPSPPVAVEPTGCLTSGCHSKFAERKVVHSPVERVQCEACHEERDKAGHKYKLTGEGDKLCVECHEAFDGKTRHSPLERGDCLSCHDPHAADAPRLLTSNSVGELCVQCHEEVAQGPKHVHGPAAAGACTACHNPHATNTKHLLVKEGVELCTECHDATKDELASGKVVHAPCANDCTLCHAPHGADNARLLRDGVPKLCFECHAEIAERVASASTPHGPVKEADGCLSCHKAHASATGKLLTKEPRELCLACHQEAQVSGDRKIRGLAAEFRDKPNLHAPVGDGSCTNCHDPHGSSQGGLLAHPYAKKFYAPYDAKSFGLCFECHESTLAEEARTDSATGFRNGTRNLHFVHVNKSDKGRSCRVCHEVHAAKGEKLIHESVPFGKWSIPIRFQPTTSGGSCASGCHRPYRYDRDSPVVQIPPLPEVADPAPRGK